MTALITGALGGLGQAIAIALAADHDIVAHYRTNPERIEAIIDQIAAIHPDRQVTPVGGDLAIDDPDALDHLVSSLITDAFEPGESGVVVLNAANQDVVAWDEMTTADFDRIWAAGVRAHAALLVAAGRRLGPGSCIITIGSIEGLRPAPAHAAYAAGKAALHHLTASAAHELGGRGIRVVGVAPGLINRAGLVDDWPDGWHRWADTTALGRPVEPAEVANTVAFVASPAASGITGVVIPVDAGWSASPGW